MKYFIGFCAFLFFFGLTTTQKVEAQGKYECRWVFQERTFGCELRSTGCEPGYKVGDCSQYKKSLDCNQVRACFKPNTPQNPITTCPNGKQGIDTALGCITTEDPAGFVGSLLKFAIAIGGGIAFLLMLFGVFQIITSSGDPERLKGGQETITSALIGLLMIIFSLFLLRLIGIKILDIPGLA